MRRFIAIALFVFFVMLPSLAFAADSADITVFVKIQKLSVAINTSSYDFGAVVAGGTNVSDTFIAVTNDGNVTEKFKLFVVSEPNGTWSSVTAGAPGSEEYRISGMFKDGAPVSGDFGPEDSFSISTERTAAAADLAKDADPAGEKGYSVAQDGARKLWFKFEAPSATVITTQQSIQVRISALAD